jgi:TnpA family transposase
MQELKREAMCDTTETLLFDILQELKTIKAMLKTIDFQQENEAKDSLSAEVGINTKTDIKKPLNQQEKPKSPTKKNTKAKG